MASEQLLSDARSVLSQAGYSVFAPDPSTAALYFEDDSVIGHIRAFDTVSALVEQWEGVQDSFLRGNALRFAHDANKSWNLYTVLLTQDAPNRPSVLTEIEEDFRGTRKIARASVVSLRHVEISLVPLLPLRRLVTVGVMDTKRRLNERLASIHPALTLLSTAPSDVVASALEDGQ